MSLTAALSEPATKERLIDDAVRFVDAEVGKKSGFSGMAIKTCYKAVKGVSPGFIRKVVNSLFGRWAEKLDPIWQEGVDKGGSPRDHFANQRSRVANALLSVTDEKAKGASSKVVASSYSKLRPSAAKHVEEAVPGLADLIAKHAG